MKIKNTEVESTPFAHITINATKKHDSAWIKLYWSNNYGTYGHQVCAEYNYGDYDANNYTQLKTSGYGYCKESEALQTIMSNILGERAYTCHYEASSLLSEYKKGGNYYELSMSQLIKVCKAVK